MIMQLVLSEDQIIQINQTAKHIDLFLKAIPFIWNMVGNVVGEQLSQCFRHAQNGQLPRLLQLLSRQHLEFCQLAAGVHGGELVQKA